MAGLATEAAFFGVPSIVGGYHNNISKDLVIRIVAIINCLKIKRTKFEMSL